MQEKILTQIFISNSQQERAEREQTLPCCCFPSYNKASALHNKKEAAQMLKCLIQTELKLPPASYNIETMLPVNMVMTTKQITFVNINLGSYQNKSGH